MLGVILSAVLILTGLIWQQVQPRSPDTVELIGEEGFILAARFTRSRENRTSLGIALIID